ncbi:hypothetical protein HEP84_47270 [Streptomyces sp. RLB1-33]|nr:hypothetical protein [Streptomyces sp. RLB1-33]QIY75511.1 hypothetical protein HEP84_47270 [Streptomyces sp. RLB1-33]
MDWLVSVALAQSVPELPIGTDTTARRAFNCCLPALPLHSPVKAEIHHRSVK